MNKSRLSEVLIALLLLCAMACAWLAVHAGKQRAEHWGPRIVEQSSDGNVWLTIDQELLIASPEGDLRKRVDLRSLNLPGPLNTLAPLPGAEARMLAGVIDMPEWLVMDGEGRVLNRIRPNDIGAAYHDTLHLATAPDGRIAMATSGDHRVLAFDANGKRLAESPAGLFRYANGLWHEDNRWWVIDTNHGLLRTLNDETLQAETSIAVPAMGLARFPALARRSPGGAITVSEMRNGMEKGVVFDMSPEGKLLHQYPSRAADPEPVAFLWIGEQLLLADRFDHTLQLFDADGRYLRPWGGEQVTAIAKTSFDERSRWARILLYAQIGAVTLGLLSILGYFASKQRPVPSERGEAAFAKLATPGLDTRAELIGGLRLYWPLALALSVFFLLNKLLDALGTVLVTALQPSLTPNLARLLILLLLIVIATTLINLAARRVARQARLPQFEALFSSHWVKWIRRSATARNALEDKESAREVLMVQTSKLFPAFNMNVWLLTDRRLLIFRPGPGTDGKLLAAIDRRDCSASIKPATGLRARLGGRDRIHVATRDGRDYSGYAGSPVTAQRVAALLGARKKLSTHWARTSTTPEMRSPEPAAAFVLSLIVPGLAQLLQDRFVLGVTLLTAASITAAITLVPVLLGWLGHFYDVPLGIGIASLMASAVWALLAASDAALYARRAHRSLARG